MEVKGLINEDLVNYRKISMTIMFPYCAFKCGTEYCQNSPLSKTPSINIGTEDIVRRYIQNPITDAIVMQGLEPFESWGDLYSLIKEIRSWCSDDIVIYTGYNKDEISEYIDTISKYNNIIVKFGRFVPDQEKHYDDVLGVFLASDNQYAERIS